MIAFLTGRVLEKGAAACVIDVGGVGFRVLMSTASLSALPAVGDDVSVRIYLHVREEELTLYGFEDDEERQVFEKLITVSGVGPKVALSALSSMRPAALAEAVAREDVDLVSSIPGVGKKTAQRIILDLKDKLGVVGMAPGAGLVQAGAVGETREALAAMGFSSAEITSALKGYGGSPEDSAALLRYALKRLGGTP